MIFEFSPRNMFYNWVPQPQDFLKGPEYDGKYELLA